MQEVSSPDFPDSCTCCATPLSPCQRLPQQLLRLSVLKLDGSRSEVGVSKTATMAELKEPVAEVFSRVTCMGSFLFMLKRSEASH